MVNRHIAGHSQHEGRLTHGGTGRYDHQVRSLPAEGDPVYPGIAGSHTAQTVSPLLVGLYLHHCLLDDVLYRLGLPLHILLRQVEQFLLGSVQQVVHRDAVIERVSLHLGRYGYQFSLYVFLKQYLYVIVHMSGRTHL